jgi:hypothetical protein
MLHQGATVMCVHGGQAQATSPVPRVKVSNQMVVVQTSPHSIAGCPFTTPGGTPQPCVTAQWTSAATRVKVNSMPVLLKDSTAVCAPNGTGVQITVTQMRVTAK